MRSALARTYSCTLIISALVLGGCMSAPQKNRWTYSCPTGQQFAAEFSRNANAVTLRVFAADQEQVYKLRKTEAASGARYATDGAVFWSKGSMARLEISSTDESGAVPQVYADCQGDSD